MYVVKEENVNLKSIFQSVSFSEYEGLFLIQKNFADPPLFPPTHQMLRAVILSYFN